MSREDIEKMSGSEIVKMLLGPPSMVKDLVKDKKVYDERENSLKERDITEDMYKDFPKNILIDSVEMKDRQCGFSLKNGEIYIHEIIPLTDFTIEYPL